MRLWEASLEEGFGLSLLRFGYEHCSQRAKWGPGKRNHYILHYVLQGKGVFNGQPVAAGQGFLIRPGETVAYGSTDNWQYFWISIKGSQAEEICQNHIPMQENGIFSLEDVGILRAVLAGLEQRDSRLMPMYALSVLYRVLGCQEAQGQVRENPYVERAKQLIRNSGGSLTVTAVARACNVDDRYLYNLFVKHTGQSPKQYMNQVRLERAKALLRESNCSVAQVAAAVGFEDGLAFSRFFSRHYGISPTAYRKA